MPSARHWGSAGHGQQLDRADRREWSGRAASIPFRGCPTPAQIVGRLSAGCRVTRERVPTCFPCKRPRSACPFPRMSPAPHLPTAVKMSEPVVGSDTPLRPCWPKLRGSAPALPVLHPFACSRELSPPTICAGTVVTPLIRLRRDLPRFRCPSLRFGTPPSKGAQRPTLNSVLPEFSF